MNLIEQLGGYEKAKEALHQLKSEKKDLISCGASVFVESQVIDALLEYRRQHNIFEVGDLVVFKLEMSDDLDLYTIDCVLDGGSFLCVNDYRQAFMSISFRHATDEEIKAGKRLGVDSE